jgi:hypothetical protein
MHILHLSNRICSFSKMKSAHLRANENVCAGRQKRRTMRGAKRPVVPWQYKCVLFFLNTHCKHNELNRPSQHTLRWAGWFNLMKIRSIFDSFFDFVHTFLDVSCLSPRLWLFISYGSLIESIMNKTSESIQVQVESYIHVTVRQHSVPFLAFPGMVRNASGP